MKFYGYLRLAGEWSVRERRGLMRCATGWEIVEGTGVGGGAGVGRVAGRDSGSTLGSGATLESGSTNGSAVTLCGVTTLGVGRGSWYWTVKASMRQDGEGGQLGVGGVRVVDVFQLDKISRSLEMAESCSWWMAAGASKMAQERKLIACTMRSDRDTVGWVR